MENLNTFVSKLVDEKGLSYLDAETLAQVRQDLLGRLESRINAAILANMPAEKLEDFEKKLDEKLSDEDIQKYCAESIPDLTELIAAEMMAFRKTYLNV